MSITLKITKPIFALAIVMSSTYAHALTVGIQGGNNGTHNELLYTLTQLGYNVVDNGYTNVDVFISASGNSSSYSLANSTNYGIGYIKIGDWGANWTSNSFHYDPVGPYGLKIDSFAHPLTTGLDTTWNEYGFHYNNSSWNPSDLPKGYLGWTTDLSLDSIVSSTSVYVHDDVVTAKDMGNYNAVYIGFEAFGHQANVNSVKLLNNAIIWASGGDPTSVNRSVPEPATIALMGFGVLGMIARRRKLA